ncbi:MAG: hypothetical protein ACE15F_22730 [bacterium]
MNNNCLPKQSDEPIAGMKAQEKLSLTLILSQRERELTCFLPVPRLILDCAFSEKGTHLPDEPKMKSSKISTEIQRQVQAGGDEEAQGGLFPLSLWKRIRVREALPAAENLVLRSHRLG